MAEMMFGLDVGLQEEGLPQGRKRNQQQSANHLLRFRPKAREEETAVKKTTVSRSKKKFSYGAFETQSTRLLVSDDCASGASDDAKDAEKAVDWLAVCATSSSGDSSCPICLETMSGALTTKCGHAFCGKCVVRHALMREFSRSKRCPCCNAPLECRDLRPHLLVPTMSKNVFVLLERRKSRRAAWAYGNEENALPYYNDSLSLFSKITLCDSSSAHEVFSSSLTALKDDEAAYAVMDAVYATFVARRALQEKRRVTSDQDEDEKRLLSYADATGSCRYLSPLALRCLSKVVDGDASKLPRFLKWKKRKSFFEQRFELCEDARKKLPWLGHVQHGAQVSLCDVDVEDLSGKIREHEAWDDTWGSRAANARDEDPTLRAALEAQIDRRKREKDKSKKIDKLLRRKKHDHDRIGLQNRQVVADAASLERFYADQRRHQRFQFRDDDFAPLSASPPLLEEENIAASPPSFAAASPPEEPSFAALVARGYAAELGFPALGSAPGRLGSSPTAPPPQLRKTNCWGTTIAPSQRKPLAPPASLLALAPDNDDFAPPPRTGLSEGIAGALDAALNKQLAPKSHKKNKHRTLSLTGGGRGRY